MGLVSIFLKALGETTFMKRIGFLYEQIVSVENCKLAILNAAKHKIKRKNVTKILDDIDFYAQDLSERLICLNFTSPYRTRIIQDGLSGKERELQIPAFYPDQCAHHAIIQVFQPIVLKSSYYWSCANIPERGIDRAARGVERATKWDIEYAKYCVKMDIRKFYPSIPHDKLEERLQEKIKDKKALAIFRTIINSYHSSPGKGLPIGNYTSPWLAEFYLQPLDHYIKQILGIKYYIRYADDLVLIGDDKRKLRKALYSIIEYTNSLGLEIKHNYQLFPIQRKYQGVKRLIGRKIDFVGRCFGIGITTVRKKRALVLMRQSRYIKKKQKYGRGLSYHTAAGFLSRSACFKRTNSHGMRKKYYDKINTKKLKEIVSNESKRQYLTRSANNRTLSTQEGVC